MIRREQLPEDAADWGAVEVRLQPLEPDSPDSCPVAREELFDHMRMESADLDDAVADRLCFVRSAQFPAASAWLRRYIEADGEVCFVTVFVWDDGAGSTAGGRGGARGRRTKSRGASSSRPATRTHHVGSSPDSGQSSQGVTALTVALETGA